MVAQRAADNRANAMKPSVFALCIIAAFTSLVLGVMIPQYFPLFVASATVWFLLAALRNDKMTRTLLSLFILAFSLCAQDKKGGASYINTFNKGATAVSRSVEEKFRDVINVKDYGAACDGAVTDDTTAIQAAITAAGAAGTVEIPPGGCRITAALTVSGSKKIRLRGSAPGPGPWGSGSILTRDASFTSDHMLKVSGSGADLTVETLEFTAGTAANYASIAVLSEAALRLRDVRINSGKYGVLNDGGDTLEVNNLVYLNGDTTNQGQAGIKIDCTGGAGSIPSNVRITNSLITGYPIGNPNLLMNGLHLACVDGAQISDVWFGGAQYPVTLEAGTDKSIMNVYMDNLLADQFTGAGLRAVGTAAGVGISYHAIRISSSDFTGHSTGTASCVDIGYTWSTGNVDNLQLVGNNFSMCQRDGIRIGAGAAGAKNILIEGNHVLSNDGEAGGYVGVRLANGTTGVQIIGNVIGNKAKGSANAQDWGVVAEGTCTNCVIQGNDLSENASGPLSLGGAFTGVIGGNKAVDDVIGTVASAVTISAPYNPVFKVTGTTQITTINGGWTGREITLVFTDASPGGIGIGGNIAQTLTAIEDQSIRFAYDGSTWWPLGVGGEFSLANNQKVFWKDTAGTTIPQLWMDGSNNFHVGAQTVPTTAGDTFFYARGDDAFKLTKPANFVLEPIDDANLFLGTSTKRFADIYTFALAAYSKVSPSTIGTVSIQSADTTSWVNLQAASVGSANYNFYFPPAGPGAADKILVTGAAPNYELAWADKPTGTVTDVTGTPPIASSGGTVPDISCPTCVTTDTIQEISGEKTFTAAQSYFTGNILPSTTGTYVLGHWSPDKRWLKLWTNNIDFTAILAQGGVDRIKATGYGNFAGVQIADTTVIDASRNLTNIGTIGMSGALTGATNLLTTDTEQTGLTGRKAWSATDNANELLIVSNLGSAGAIYASSASVDPAVEGVATTSVGISGYSVDSYGVRGTSTNSYGIYGASTNSIGGYFSGGAGSVAVYGVGPIHATTYFVANGQSGLTAVKTVRKGDDSGSCTLTFTGGILTASTCD